MKGRAGSGGPGAACAVRTAGSQPSAPNCKLRDRADCARAAGQFETEVPTVSNPTRWVGVDLHRRRSQIAIIDEHGELALSRRIVNHPDTFRELLGDPDGTHVALEATYGWEWLADLLEEAGYDVHLTHPLRTQAIAAARVKTDAVDAKTLAHLLRTGLLPEAYIAPPELRDLRELLRHRAVLTRMRTAVKNRVHALLARQGIPQEHADLFGKAGREFLAGFELPEGSRRRLDSLMSLIGDFDREITATTREIDARAKTDDRWRARRGRPSPARTIASPRSR